MLGGLLAADYHQVAGQDARLQHRLSPNPQGERLVRPCAGVKGKIILNAFFRQNRTSGGSIADNRHPVPHRRFHQGNGTAFSGPLGDHPRRRHVFEVEMNGGGGPQAHCAANFTHRRGIPLLLNGGCDIIIDFLLHIRELYHKSSLLPA